jgi:hypothetical protein
MTLPRQKTRKGAPINIIILAAAFIVTIPLLVVAFGLISLVLQHRVTGSLSFFQEDNYGSDSGAYYVQYSATALTTLASWLSLIAPYLPINFMILLSLPCSASLAHISSQEDSKSLPTPDQLIAIIQLLNCSWEALRTWCNARSIRQMKWINILASTFVLGYIFRLEISFLDFYFLSEAVTNRAERQRINLGRRYVAACYLNDGLSKPRYKL